MLGQIDVVIKPSDIAKFDFEVANVEYSCNSKHNIIFLFKMLST